MYVVQSQYSKTNRNIQFIATSFVNFYFKKSNVNEAFIIFRSICAYCKL